jgi:hypothetical protein
VGWREIASTTEIEVDEQVLVWIKSMLLDYVRFLQVIKQGRLAYASFADNRTILHRPQSVHDTLDDRFTVKKPLLIPDR